MLPLDSLSLLGVVCALLRELVRVHASLNVLLVGVGVQADDGGLVLLRARRGFDERSSGVSRGDELGREIVGDEVQGVDGCASVGSAACHARAASADRDARHRAPADGESRDALAVGAFEAWFREGHDCGRRDADASVPRCELGGVGGSLERGAGVWGVVVGCIVGCVFAPGLGPAGHDVALLGPHPAPSRAGAAARPTLGGAARFASHERPSGGLHGRDVGARVPVLLIRALADHRAGEVGGALDPDGRVGVGEPSARRAHELADGIEVVVVEGDELAGVAVGLAGEQDPAAVGMVPLERARHADGRGFVRDACERRARALVVRVNCVFLNGRNFGSGRLSSIHELCGTYTKGGASGEVSGAMTTDGDPGGTLDSHTNGMSEGQILSMEVRPETRPSATSSASFSNFPEPRKTTMIRHRH